MRSFGGGLLGGLAGGMLFRSLFGGPAAQSGTGAGATGGGGIGLMDILLLARHRLPDLLVHQEKAPGSRSHGGILPEQRQRGTAASAAVRAAV